MYSSTKSKTWEAAGTVPFAERNHSYTMHFLSTTQLKSLINLTVAFSLHFPTPNQIHFHALSNDDLEPIGFRSKLNSPLSDDLIVASGHKLAFIDPGQARHSAHVSELELSHLVLCAKIPQDDRLVQGSRGENGTRRRPRKRRDLKNKYTKSRKMAHEFIQRNKCLGSVEDPTSLNTRRPGASFVDLHLTSSVSNGEGVAQRIVGQRGDRRACFH